MALGELGLDKESERAKPGITHYDTLDAARAATPSSPQPAPQVPTGLRAHLCEPLDMLRRSLRRFTYSAKGQCPAHPNWGHDASAHIDDVPIEWRESDGRKVIKGYESALFKEDPRWPAQCSCGYTFQPVDEWQVSSHRLYRRVDNGQLLTQHEFKPGAIWRAEWYEGLVGYGGPDGKVYCAICPDGKQWCIDGPCSNCTRRGEPHHCWVRNGEAPNFTINKDGNTCAAGAGSVDTGTWHGHLVNGVFIP